MQYIACILATVFNMYMHSVRDIVFWMTDRSHRTYIYFLYNCPLGKMCGLTEGTVWDKELAMAPVIIHPSKEPDGEGKVSVKILFLD